MFGSTEAQLQPQHSKADQITSIKMKESQLPIYIVQRHVFSRIPMQVPDMTNNPSSVDVHGT
jgi:hypothetical protein